MTEEIIIDVNECPHKSDDDCMEVPICNEYGDLMGYQSCEAQTLCPYRSQKKIERLEQELKWANDEEKYLKDCCIKAGKELEKNSFAWDGKEKNLVVQALELNKRYEILEQENKELKELNKKICEDWEKEIKVYWNALEEIREIAKDIIENDVYENSDVKAENILDKINEVLNLS